jgi:uncharacterized membrane protein
VTQTFETTETELTQRHRVAVMTVLATVALTLLLLAFAFAGLFSDRPKQPDPSLRAALSFAIVLFALGAVTLRRTRFATARLQDIASVRGTSALLRTLQNTTMLVALIGGVIAVMGFVITLNTGNPYDMVRYGIIAAAVLLYAYPRRAAWRRVVAATQTNDGLDAAATPSAKGTIA